MCSNYLFPNKRNLTLLGVDASQFDLELKDHVFPSYHAPIILNGSDHLEWMTRTLTTVMIRRPKQVGYRRVLRRLRVRLLR